MYQTVVASPPKEVVMPAGRAITDAFDIEVGERRKESVSEAVGDKIDVGLKKCVGMNDRSVLVSRWEKETEVEGRRRLLEGSRGIESFKI